MAWLSIVLSFIGILFSPYLQVGDCGCPICSGAVHEPAKIKKKESGGGGSVIIDRDNEGIQGGGGARVVATDSVAATDAAVAADAELELATVPRRPNPFVADNNPFAV
jgi:hypothetical protein